LLLLDTTVKLHLPAYPEGIHEIHESVEPRELELDTSQFPNPVEANLRLDRHDPYLDFRILLETSASAECDRCLEPIELKLTAKSPMLYVFGHPPKGDDVDDTEIAYIRAGTTELDLSAQLRDLLILAYSGRHLCSDDCKGLCPTCGANLNLDSCECHAEKRHEDFDN
jgi:uncharacterized protein